jgi:hypothetical protein
MRVLVTVTPRMYRQAIALSIPSSEAAEGELVDFRPHLLVHNDNDRLGPEAVEDVPFRVEVQYSDGMDARISVEGEVFTACAMCLEDLLRVVARATALAERETEQS